MKAPTVIQVEAVVHSVKNGPRSQTEIGGIWVEARPIHYCSLKRRFTLAWKVFIGDYDALSWWGQ